MDYGICSYTNRWEASTKFPPDKIKVEKLGDDLKAGDKVVFDKGFVGDNGKDTTIGTPYIDGAKVGSNFEKAGRHSKVIIGKITKQKSRYPKAQRPPPAVLSKSR